MRMLFIKKFEKIYLFVCLCMNKQKLERKKQKVKTFEENQILREDYMKSLEFLKELYENGELILNSINIEKLKLYLSKENILSTAGQLKYQISDVKSEKRNQRKFQFKKNTEQMRSSIAKVEEKCSDQNLLDSIHQQQTNNLMQSTPLPKGSLRNSSYFKKQVEQSQELLLEESEILEFNSEYENTPQNKNQKQNQDDLFEKIYNNNQKIKKKNQEIQKYTEQEMDIDSIMFRRKKRQSEKLEKNKKLSQFQQPQNKLRESKQLNFTIERQISVDLNFLNESSQKSEEIDYSLEALRQNEKQCSSLSKEELKQEVSIFQIMNKKKQKEQEQLDQDYQEILEKDKIQNLGDFKDQENDELRNKQRPVSKTNNFFQENNMSQPKLEGQESKISQNMSNEKDKQLLEDILSTS